MSDQKDARLPSWQFTLSKLMIGIAVLGVLLMIPQAISGNPIARMVLILTLYPLALWIAVEFVRKYVVQMDAEQHDGGFPRI